MLDKYVVRRRKCARTCLCACLGVKVFELLTSNYNDTTNKHINDHSDDVCHHGGGGSDDDHGYVGDEEGVGYHDDEDVEGEGEADITT